MVVRQSTKIDCPEERPIIALNDHLIVSGPYIT